MRALFVAAALAGVASSAETLSCGHCATIQEAIQRSIVHNISAFEGKSHVGTSTTATIEIGQIIWRLCGSDTWKEQRY